MKPCGKQSPSIFFYSKSCLQSYRNCNQSSPILIPMTAQLPALKINTAHDCDITIHVYRNNPYLHVWSASGAVMYVLYASNRAFSIRRDKNLYMNQQCMYVS